MQKAASEPPDSTEPSQEGTSNHFMATHAGSRLLQGQAERGELRAGTAAGKFQTAAKKVMVTKEVLDMLHGCSNELRQVQQEFKESRASTSDADGLAQKPAGAKSLKARQNEAIAAADAAAMYSLRSQERGRVDAAAGNKQAAPQKPALPADWGFLQNVDRLQAAPPAAAARPNGEGQQRPEQPYLSYDAATKAAHEAWQPQEEAGWRKVLTQKKHRQANKAQIEEAERERAAKFIQANWLLHQHRKQEKLRKEQQLTQWAEEHLAAARKSRMSLAAAGDESDSDSDKEASSSSAKWRRNRPTGEEAVQKPAKPVVQPWARMIGREAPMTDGIAPPTPTAGKSKWRGAVSATVAAKMLTNSSSTADRSGSNSLVANEDGAALLLQEVAVTRVSDEGAGAVLSRTASSLPPAAGGSVARTSSFAGALSSVLGIFRGKSSTDGAAKASSWGSSSAGSSSDGGTVSKPATRLTSRLSMDLAAFFGGGAGSKHRTADLHRDGSGIRAPDPASKPVGLMRRVSQDLTAFFGGGGYKAAQGSGHSPATSQSHSRRATAQEVGPDAGPSSSTPHTAAAAAAAPVQAPLQPTPPISRRRSVEFVRNLFRRGSVDLSAQQQSQQQQQQQSQQQQQQQEGPSPGNRTPGGRTADVSRFVTAESIERSSQLPSPLLSNCATARTSWSDTEGISSSNPPGHSDLVARGAAAAAAYLEAASVSLANREAVLSLCGAAQSSSATPAQPSTVSTQAADAGTFSLSGGIAGSSGTSPAGVGRNAAGSPQGHGGCKSNRSSVEFMSCDAPVEGDSPSGRPSFESVWTKIQAGSSAAGQSADSTTPSPAAAAAAAAASAPPPADGHTPAATSGTVSHGRSKEGAKPKAVPVVGQGELGFQPNRAVLVTAADVTSSSFYKASKPPATAADAAKPAAGTAVAFSGVALAAGSSLFASGVQPAGSKSNKVSAGEPSVPATGVPLAASSGLYAPTAPCSAGFVGRPKPPAVAVARQQVQLNPGPPSPAVSDSACSSANSSPPLSPSRHTMPAWGPGSPGRSPHPPKDAVSIIGSRPGPRGNILSRQKGQKSADMSADAAAAVAARPVTSIDLGDATAATAAAALTVKAGSAAGVGRPASAGRSSVSQKLEIARRMAATAGEDGEGASSSAAALGFQMDGSASKSSGSTSHSSGAGRASSREQHSTEAASTFAGVAAGNAAKHGSAGARGASSKGSRGGEAGALKPMGLATAAAQQAGSNRGASWLAEPICTSLKSPVPSVAALSVVNSSTKGPGGAGPAAAAGSLLPSSGSRVGGRSSSSSTPTKTLPGLMGSAAQQLASSSAARGALSGPVSPVGLVGAGDDGVMEQRPRRNSFSNDGSKPSGGQGGQGAGLGSKSGRLMPSTGRRSVM